MKRAVGYIGRGVSEAERLERKKDIEKYCLRRNMALEWVDFGSEDGATFGGIAYGDWLTGRKVDAVVVAYSDDVSEDFFEFYAYRAVLRRRHSDLIAVSDTGFPGYQLYGKILDRFIDTMCRIDLENAPIRKTNDRMDKAARGKYIGGNPPMGYMVVDGKLEVNPDEVPVVLLIMERKRTGKTMLSTVDVLNQNGYKTRRGGKFVISTVQSIWNNEMFYKGYYRYGKDGEWVPGKHEAILKD